MKLGPVWDNKLIFDALGQITRFSCWSTNSSMMLAAKVCNFKTCCSSAAGKHHATSGTSHAFTSRKQQHDNTTAYFNNFSTNVQHFSLKKLQHLMHPFAECLRRVAGHNVRKPRNHQRWHLFPMWRAVGRSQPLPLNPASQSKDLNALLSPRIRQKIH